MALEPTPVTVKRWVCPGCHRSWSRRASTLAHMERCWKNPDNRACKTCVHYDEGICCDGTMCGCRGESEPDCAVEYDGFMDSTDNRPIIVNCPMWSQTG